MHLTADISNNLGSLKHCKQPWQLEQNPRSASGAASGLRSMHAHVAYVQDSARPYPAAMPGSPRPENNSMRELKSPGAPWVASTGIIIR